jgi:hypothetical protein
MEYKYFHNTDDLDNAYITLLNKPFENYVIKLYPEISNTTVKFAWEIHLVPKTVSDSDIDYPQLQKEMEEIINTIIQDSDDRYRNNNT